MPANPEAAIQKGFGMEGNYFENYIATVVTGCIADYTDNVV
jgi:hypothetical protein